MSLQGLVPYNGLSLATAISVNAPKLIVAPGARIASIGVTHLSAAGAAAGISLHFGASAQGFPLESAGTWTNLADHNADDGLYYSVTAPAAGETLSLAVSFETNQRLNEQATFTQR